MEEEKITGRIYMIVPDKKVEEGDVYIGSTVTKLKRRYLFHKNSYSTYARTGNRNHFCTSFILFDKYGVDNCECIEIEKVDVESVKDLKIKEREIMEQTKCINSNRAYITDEERRIQKKDVSNNLKQEVMKYKKELEPPIIPSELDIELKVCRLCNESKPESCFRVASRRCRKCLSKASTEKNKEYMKQYYEKRKEKIKSRALVLYNEVYKPIREKMNEAKGEQIRKRGGQQKYFKPENLSEIKNI